jgi:DNA-binding response OmpR family regulator
VLVADDDEALRSYIAHTLRKDGYTVVEAADGHQALDYLAGVEYPLPPDVVLLDVRMRHLSGFGVLDALQRANVVVPVIVMSLLDDASVDVVAKGLGAVGVLHKPIDVDDLRTAVLNAERVLAAARSPHPR